MLDFYQDATGDILRLILEEKGSQIPECVLKSASLLPSEELRREHNIFAWPERRLFAIDTPQDVWLSAEYFKKTAHRVPFQYREAIAGAIKEAAELFAVPTGDLLDKVASEEVSDDVFLVVVNVPADSRLAKRASEAVDLGDGQVTVRLYPVRDAEHTRKSATWFPRDLEGPLCDLRRKVAHDLLDACERFGVTPPDLLIEEVRPIKLSKLVQHIQQRIGLIGGHNDRATRNMSLRKAASERKVELPYDLPALEPIDNRVVRVYDELLKMAHRRDIDETFWTLLERTDKVAGIERFTPEAVPASSLHREVEDDIRITSCKLAGANGFLTVVSLPQVMSKVSREMWEDLAPDLVDHLHDLHKVAETIEKLDPLAQRAILARVRGY